MKISISNIAWASSPLQNYLRLIKQLGCNGIELAPSLIWNEPIMSSKEERKNIKSKIQSFDLEIVGFHALLFTRKDLKLFYSQESRKDTKNYLRRLLELCSDLGGKQIIFGSPANRKIYNRKYRDCLDQSVEDFYSLAEHARANNVIICIEPLSRKETEFIQSTQEGIELVKRINHPNFKLHIDTKSIFNNKEDVNSIIPNCENLLQHVHVGDVELKEPGTINYNHKKIGQALRNINYNNYVSIEMRENKDDVEGSIKRSINYVKNNYLSHINE